MYSYKHNISFLFVKGGDRVRCRERFINRNGGGSERRQENWKLQFYVRLPTLERSYR